MSEFEKIKDILIKDMQKLCAHCSSGNFPHECPIKHISAELAGIRGVPLMVNSEFRGIIFK